MLDSLKAHFLIAGKRLRDPNFFKSVVLIVEHAAGGAMGLVVNRPTSVTVATALAEHFQLPETEDRVHQGGPVEPAGLFILHNSHEHGSGAVEVLPGLYVGNSAEVFEQVVRVATEGESDVQFRVFSGCAGWGPGQLEAELARADWYVQPADADAVFIEDPYECWDHLLRQAQADSPVLKAFEGDPDLN